MGCDGGRARRGVSSASRASPSSSSSIGPCAVQNHPRPSTRRPLSPPRACLFRPLPSPAPTHLVFPSSAQPSHSSSLRLGHSHLSRSSRADANPSPFVLPASSTVVRSIAPALYTRCLRPQRRVSLQAACNNILHALRTPLPRASSRRVHEHTTCVTVRSTLSYPPVALHARRPALRNSLQPIGSAEAPGVRSPRASRTYTSQTALLFPAPQIQHRKVVPHRRANRDSQHRGERTLFAVPFPTITRSTSRFKAIVPLSSVVAVPSGFPWQEPPPNARRPSSPSFVLPSHAWRARDPSSLHLDVLDSMPPASRQEQHIPFVQDTAQRRARAQHGLRGPCGRGGRIDQDFES